MYTYVCIQTLFLLWTGLDLALWLSLDLMNSSSALLIICIHHMRRNNSCTYVHGLIIHILRTYGIYVCITIINIRIHRIYVLHNAHVHTYVLWNCLRWLVCALHMYVHTFFWSLPTCVHRYTLDL